MKQIHIISIGKLNNNYKGLENHYQKLIKHNLKSTEISYAKKLPPEQIKQFEAKLIDQYLDKKSYKIVLNVLGKDYTSQEFTKLIDFRLQLNQNIQFIIGGAFGLDKAIIDKANIQISLSKMTMTHQMTKILLLEQIYCAQTILENHPYHK
ncbi:MAG: 23S rRNA (pseudouridine(1915)-N(3))-methyltransferase RlmH [Rickettsia endosymbiont of Bryobia graminum]|nr:23S rRNA (pseudouridine(1915)-N(3))-methyltransferase RlmH [Rickettsia endosymbiont of Bryobia graminum]